MNKNPKDIILDGEVIKPKQQPKLDPIMGNSKTDRKPDPFQLQNLEKRFDLTES